MATTFWVRTAGRRWTWTTDGRAASSAATEDTTDSATVIRYFWGGGCMAGQTWRGVA